MGFDVKDWQNSPSTATPLSAAAIEDVEQRLSDYTDDQRDAILGGPVFYPEDYGAVADGVTDSTTALQACIDDAFDADQEATIVLSQGVYLVNGAPRTDRTGHSILSLTQSRGDPKGLRIMGAASSGLNGDVSYVGGAVRPKTIIKTTRTTDDYSASFGPPSVLGAATVEQGAESTTPLRYCGPIFLQNFAIQVPLNPTIAGVDGFTFGGMEVQNCSVIAGTGGDAVAAPTNAHAFGFRWPSIWNNIVNKSLRAQAFQMYAGHLFRHSAFHVADSSWSTRCVIAYAWEDGGNDSEGLTFVCALAGACKYMLAGLDLETGVIDVPFRASLMQSYMQTDLGTSPFDRVNDIKDASNNLVGELQWAHFNGLTYSTALNVDGGQKLTVRMGNSAVPTVASAAALTVPPYADTIKVSGSVTITSITASRAQREVTLIFTSTAQVTDGSNLKLAGNFTGAADRTLRLVCDGTDWWEAGRSAN
jgi:hypothetical protein